MFESGVLLRERDVDQWKQPVDRDIAVPRGPLGGLDRFVRPPDLESERRHHGVVRPIARERAEAVEEGREQPVMAEEGQEANRGR